jgi:hypothetical protein
MRRIVLLFTVVTDDGKKVYPAWKTEERRIRFSAVR